jgi:hypothetical protein
MKRLDKSGRSSRARRSASQIREVVRLEKEVWRAARQRDVQRFTALVPQDALMIFQTGIVTQPAYVATMQDRTLESNEIADLRGYMPNSRTVILTYRTVRAGSEKGSPFPSGSVVESTVWIKRGKRWVAVLNQETPLVD